MERFLELLEKRKKQSKNISWIKFYNTEELDYILNFIIEENKTKSMTNICKKYKIGRKQTRKYLKDIKDFSPINKQNLLRVKENLFNTIKTEEDAYWLGFLLADGYISDDGKVELSLQKSDKNHLIKFAKYCKFDINKVKEDNFRCRIGFAMQQYKNNLFSKNMLPRKSLTLTYPKDIPDHLQRHLIRGYFDGDGSIYIGKLKNKNRKTPPRSICLYGTKEFLTKINKLVNLPIKNIRLETNIHVINFSCKEADSFLNTLYNNSTIYLDRKYEKYKIIAPLFRNR